MKNLIYIYNKALNINLLIHSYSYSNIKMSEITQLTDFFLFVLKSDTNVIFAGVDKFNHLGVQSMIDLIITMRANFGKFFNLVDENCINQLIILSTKSNKNENTDNGKLFDSINILVKYADNVNLIDFVEKFFSYDRVKAKQYIREYKNKESVMYDIKNIAHYLKHNLMMFWLSLIDVDKQKILDMIEYYFTNELSKIEFDIVFKKNQVKYTIPTIDCFDKSKKNVIEINKLKDYKNLYTLIENKNEKNVKSNIKVDTIILDSIDLSEETIEVPFDIKNIKIKYCEISNLDWLHENIEIIHCDNNYITQLDNLSRGIKILICSNNKISNLDNLPEGLEYLDAHSNTIEKLNSLPSTLRYLKCSNNKIDCIDNLPNNLVYLDCSKNKIYTWTKLPDYLEDFTCKSNKLSAIDELKFSLGIKWLNLSNNYIKEIYSLNSNIELLIFSDNHKIKIYDSPNMLRTPIETI